MKSLSAIYGFEAYFADVIEYLKDRVNLFEEKIGEFDMSKLYGKPVEKAALVDKGSLDVGWVE